MRLFSNMRLFSRFYSIDFHVIIFNIPLGYVTSKINKYVTETILHRVWKIKIILIKCIQLFQIDLAFHVIR